MPTDQIIPVVLCGGSGTRLWPVSRKSFPKQFVPLIDGKNLLEMTLTRLRKLSEQVVCVTGEEHRFLVAEAQEAAQTPGKQILEPSGKNTAAAMALAALQVASESEADPLLLFCPADQHIPDSEAFVKTIHQGIAAAQRGAIVTFGVIPTFPSTAYGYIGKGTQNRDGSFVVSRFIEKPDAHNATLLLISGNVLWNAGIFLVSAKTLLNALAEQAPDILNACRQAMSLAQLETTHYGHCFIRPDATIFNQCRSESIDYAVLEKHPNTVVVPFDGVWSDVGSWNAVAELTPADDSGNRITGQGNVFEARNTYIHAPHRPVAALGTDDLLIVDTPDALLVAHRHYAEHVKQIVGDLETQGCNAAVAHRRVARPWGWYDSVDMGPNFQVKRIAVKPGASLSLQRHRHRAEHWIVVKGTAEVTCGKEIFTLTENESTFIPMGEVHRLRNPSQTELEMIEVQSGSYLGEDDIERLDDTYGRVKVA